MEVGTCFRDHPSMRCCSSIDADDDRNFDDDFMIDWPCGCGGR